MEVTVRGRSRADVQERYRSHLGGGWALVDNWGYSPIADGWCYEIVPDGMYVHYVIGGGWKRHTDQYETTQPDPADDIADYIQTMLAAHVPAISSDYSNIATTGTVLGDTFRIESLIGARVADVIAQLLPMSTSADLGLIYYTKSALLSGTSLQAPLAVLSAISDAAAIDWQCEYSDLQGITMSRSIWELRNNVKIGYTQSTTLAAGAASGATAISVVSSTNLADNNEIQIELNSGTFQRTTINGAPTGGGPYTVNIDNALTHAAASGNQVKRTDPVKTSDESDATSVSRYWGRGYGEIKRDFDQTQAEQWRGALLAEYKDPTQESSFTIGPGVVRNAYGAKYPIWRMLERPSYLRVNAGLFDTQVFGASRNRETVFFVTALDYDHSSRTMRVVPDAKSGDRRLDVILQRLGAQTGQIVTRSE
jgi:hypothetical protein